MVRKIINAPLPIRLLISIGAGITAAFISYLLG